MGAKKKGITPTGLLPVTTDNVSQSINQSVNQSVSISIVSRE